VKDGLQTLLNDDGMPPKQMNHLIRDITRELRVLDFSPAIPGAVADPSVVRRLQTMQAAVTAFVHDTPALVAYLPQGGW
jgi:hypothetical protein